MYPVTAIYILAFKLVFFVWSFKLFSSFVTILNCSILFCFSNVVNVEIYKYYHPCWPYGFPNLPSIIFIQHPPFIRYNFALPDIRWFKIGIKNVHTQPLLIDWIFSSWCVYNKKCYYRYRCAEMNNACI